MSFILKQYASAESNGTASSVSATFPSGVTAGNLVVAVANAGGSTTFTITDSTNANTYSSAASALVAEGPSPYFYQFQGSFSVVTSGGSGFVVTATPVGNPYLSLSISEWSFDGYVGKGSSSSSNVTSSPAGAGSFLVYRNSLVIANFIQYSTQNLWSPGVGFATLQNTLPANNVQIGTFVEYLANVSGTIINPTASMVGSPQGSAFSFGVEELASPYEPINLNYYVSKWGLLILALTDPLPSDETGVYPIVAVTAVNADPDVLVNGRPVSKYGPIWSNRGNYWAFVAYWLECGSVRYITMAAGGENYTNASASWLLGSGGGSSLILGTPVLANGITSYTIVSSGSGMTDGTYQWLMPTQGSSCSVATAYVTVSGGIVTSVVPICGSVFGMGAGYTGATMTGNTFTLAGGSSATITANIDQYVQSVPIVSSSSDFTSQPTIIITGDGSGAVAAPIMSGPSSSDSITMSLAGAGLGCSLGSTNALVNVPVTNWVGQTEGPTGHLLGFNDTPTMPVGGDIGGAMAGLTSNLFLAKNKISASFSWTGTDLVTDAFGFPISAAPGSTISCNVLGDYIGADCPPQGDYKIVFNDAYYAVNSTIPAPTSLVVGSNGNCSRPPYTLSRSGTAITITQPISLATNFANYNYGFGIGFIVPSDGLWHISNLRILAPGNEDTYFTNKYDCDDQLIAALTGPNGETPGLLRPMDNFLGFGGNSNFITPDDVPAYGSYQSWVTASNQYITCTLTELRTLNTDPSSVTWSWSSTKLYVWDNELPTLSDSFGTYLDMTAGPLGVNDMGNITQPNNGIRSEILICEFVCSEPHGFKTLQQVNFPAQFVDGLTANASIAGSVTMFQASRGTASLTCFVTSATTFFVGFPVLTRGNTLQYITNTSPIAISGTANVQIGMGNGSPAQFGANMISRFPGTALMFTLPGYASTALYQQIMGWIASYLVDTNNPIILEFGDEPWNTSNSFAATLSQQSNWAAYIPSGTSCFNGYYLSTGAGLSTAVCYALKAGSAFKTCIDELKRLGISPSRISVVYSGHSGDSSLAATYIKTIQTYNLPLGFVSIDTYTGGGDGDTTTITAMQPAGYPGGAGNLSIKAINEFIKHTLNLAPFNWASIGSIASLMSTGMGLCAYEGGVTSPLQDGIIHQMFLAEDMLTDESAYDLIRAFFVAEQRGNPLRIGGGLAFGSYFSAWGLSGNGGQGPLGTWIGQPLWKLGNGYAQPQGVGHANLFYTPQGGQGSDGSHPAGYSAGVGYAGNESPGVLAMVKWNAHFTTVASRHACTLFGNNTGFIVVP